VINPRQYRTRIQTAFVILALVGVLMLLSGCELSLAQDVTPPPNYQRFSLERPAADDVFVAPADSPNLASGAAIFAESCAPCHGESGMGGGSQADQLPKQPPNIGSTEIAAQASPVDWFAMVTLGKIDALMPPFEDDLSVQQRWDVLAYVYSLAESEDVLASVLPEGLEIVDQPPASEETPAVADQPQATDPAQETGEPDAAGTPAAGETPQADTNGAETPAASQDGDEPVDQLQTGRVFGTVTHGGGVTLPQDIEVNLLAFDGFEPAFELTTNLNEDGTYSFEDIELAPDRVFLTTIIYQGMNYGSHFNFMPEGETQLELPVTIFETTSDVGDLVITWLAVRVEFTSPDFARLHLFYQISNPTDVTVIPAGPEEPLLTYRLPFESQNFAFEQEFIGDHFVVTEDGFGDTRSILAESEDYTLAFTYEVPYQDEYTLELPLQIPVESLFVFLPADGPALDSAGYEDAGETVVGEQLYQVMSRSAVLPGDLSIQVQGRNPQAAPGIFGITLDLQFLVALSLLSISLFVAAYWYFRLRPAAAVQKADSSETLMDAIISLDIAFENGDMAESQYQTRRADLKARLAELMDAS